MSMPCACHSCTPDDASAIWHTDSTRGSPNAVHYSITVNKLDKGYRLGLADTSSSLRQHSATRPKVTRMVLFVEAEHIHCRSAVEEWPAQSHSSASNQVAVTSRQMQSIATTSLGKAWRNCNTGNLTVKLADDKHNDGIATAGV